MKNLLDNPQVDIYDVSTDFDSHMSQASLVIGHAGAGTLIELVSSHTPAIIVINDTLDDNHQAELADKITCLNREGEVPSYFKTEPSQLIELVRNLFRTLFN